MFARRGFAIAATHLGLFSVARSYCDSKQNKNHSLNDIIPPFKSNLKGHFVNEATCINWAMECTQDYQKLGYGPINFLTIVAFLRLLGAEEISLAQISYNILTRKAYVNELPVLPEKIEPILITQVPQAFLSIKELHNPPNTGIKYRQANMEQALLHILPSMVHQATLEFDQGAISKLYQTVSNLSDNDIKDFVTHFMPNQNAGLQADLTQRLKMAREACTRYCATQQPQSTCLNHTAAITLK